MTAAASDRALILELLETFKEHLLAQDIDRLMSLYSETFYGQGMTKRSLREALAGMKANGGLNNLEVSIDNAAIAINDGIATVSPVFVSGSTATYTIAREGSSWFISAMEEAVFVSGDVSLNTKLILIEGLPGSGKSTVANYISSKLTEFGVGHYS